MHTRRISPCLSSCSLRNVSQLILLKAHKQDIMPQQRASFRFWSFPPWNNKICMTDLHKRHQVQTKSIILHLALTHTRKTKKDLAWFLACVYCANHAHSYMSWASQAEKNRLHETHTKETPGQITRISDRWSFHLHPIQHADFLRTLECIDFYPTHQPDNLLEFRVIDLAISIVISTLYHSLDLRLRQAQLKLCQTLTHFIPVYSAILVRIERSKRHLHCVEFPFEHLIQERLSVFTLFFPHLLRSCFSRYRWNKMFLDSFRSTPGWSKAEKLVTSVFMQTLIPFCSCSLVNIDAPNAIPVLSIIFVSCWETGNTGMSTPQQTTPEHNITNDP